MGLKAATQAGRTPYGQSSHVIHVRRTDLKPEDDAPVLGPPSNANSRAKSRATRSAVRMLYQGVGEVEHTQCLDPASQSPIVRGNNR